MNIQSLDGPVSYFDQVVKPTHDDFMAQPSAFKTAIHLASTLFHIHEWVFEFKRPEIEAIVGQQFSTKGELWRHVEAVVPEAAYVRDVANASKHVALRIKPSTSMTHIANTVIQSVGYGEGAYGSGPYGGTPAVVMKDASGDVSFDDCAEKLFLFWSQMVDQLR